VVIADPVLIDNKKKFFSFPLFNASVLISSRTSFEGLFYPNAPSMREYFFVPLMFLISAEEKYVGAAEVALATSLMKKFFSSEKDASFDRNIFAMFFP